MAGAVEPDRQLVALVMCGSFNPVTNMHLRMFELARDALRNAGYDAIIGFISPVSDGYKKRDLVSTEHRCNLIRAALDPPGWILLDTFEASLPNWMPTRDALEYFQKKVDDWYEKIGEETGESEAKRPKLVCDLPKHLESASSFSERQQTGLAAMYDRGSSGRRSPSPVQREPSAPKSTTEASTSNAYNNSKVRVMFLCGADLFESFAQPGLWADEDILTIAGRFGIVCINRYGSNADRLIYESDLLNDNRQNIFVVSDWIVNEISSTKVRRALRRGESVRYLLQDSVIDYIYKNNLYGAIPPVGDRNAPHEFSKYFSFLEPSSNSINEPTTGINNNNQNGAISTEEKQSSKS